MLNAFCNFYRNKNCEEIFNQTSKTMDHECISMALQLIFAKVSKLVKLGISKIGNCSKKLRQL